MQNKTDINTGTLNVMYRDGIQRGKKEQTVKASDKWHKLTCLHPMILEQ